MMPPMPIPPPPLTECVHCGLIHKGRCQRIKAIDFYPSGDIRRIEYHPPDPAAAFVTVDGDVQEG